MGDRHSLLRRQLLRHFGRVPVPPELEELLSAVDNAYREFDADRRMLERSLELSSQELLLANSDMRAIFQAIPDRFFRIDVEGRIHDYKAGEESEAHATPRSVIGKNIREVLPALTRAQLEVAVAGVRDSKSTVTIEYAADDGAHYEARFLPLSGGHIIVMVRNISERKNMLAQLVFADRMASVGAVSAGLAHEVNNPLGFVIANLSQAVKVVEAMVRGTGYHDLGTVLEWLKDASEGAERVRQIVRDLKTFSRSDDEGRSKVDLRTTLDSAIKMVRNEVIPRAKLVRDYREVPSVEGSQGRLHQVFLNVLLNAAQAIPEGSPDKNEIAVVTRTDERGRAVVEIKDTGGGIRPEDLERVFDPFFTTKPPGEGSGLGLAICHAIVTGLAGEMSVTSRLGEGSTFRIVLPPAQAPIYPAPLAGIRTTAKRRMLVVDDEEKIGVSLERALEDDHVVVSETSAPAALDRIARGERYDVILCDLMMPGMSGMEFFRRLETLEPGLMDKVVFITGGAFTASAREFLDRIPNRRLFKPIDIEKLRAVTRARS